jgi:hypothetical protein
VASLIVKPAVHQYVVFFITRSVAVVGIIDLLIALYAHQPDVISQLENQRINPDFTSQYRDDLEFYIPQLCSFFLQGNYEH